ncbi:MAG: hypothetical protein ABI406_17275 [Ktedonobacteraceae bacterium]
MDYDWHIASLLLIRTRHCCARRVGRAGYRLDIAALVESGVWATDSTLLRSSSRAR